MDNFSKPQTKVEGLPSAAPCPNEPIRPKTMLRPLPALPSADCVSDDPEGRLGLAVALDILATRTRTIKSTPAILESLSHALWALRDSASADQDLRALLQTARGPVGFARARINEGLALALSPVRRPQKESEQPDSSISEIHQTLSLIDQAAAVLVAKESLSIRAGQKTRVAKA